jgi:hypothetical protein
MDKNEVTELIKAIRNRCDIYMLICDNPIADHLLPTLLEDLHYDSQAIIDGYCVEKEVTLSHCADNPFDCEE